MIRQYLIDWRDLHFFIVRFIKIRKSKFITVSRCAHVNHEHHATPPVTQLSESELMLRNSARQFAKNVLKPAVRGMDERSQLDENVLKALFANGFMGVEVPEQYGGPGASLFDVVIIVEELAKVGSFCLSEPSAGSDAFAMKTVAKREGDDYIITGNKLWISSAKEAKFFIVCFILHFQFLESN
ncbi:unnamed protein product [Gongylonema pulchrum]|uniref:Short/branched chain specific acyl-CoA dehydrogenase, mitochondrial n=1 Tax=Gongylonema pulchrum TaxID=637853 RepID=A0A183EJZ2_9BILA|nr:unnamed protein product [Gongylonema pulchrum]